jgi:catechol 2,3-dioxygenase-like lactoylglutathione lyase family enzyme
VIRALHHVQVAAPAGCEPAARAFYGGLLGLPEVAKPAELRGRGGVWFGLGDGGGAGQQLHVGVERDFVPARKAHPALAVASITALEALAQRLAGAGAAVTWDESIPEVRRFYTADPWGNRIELIVGSDLSARAPAG